MAMPWSRLAFEHPIFPVTHLKSLPADVSGTGHNLQIPTGTHLNRHSPSTEENLRDLYRALHKRGNPVASPVRANGI